MTSNDLDLSELAEAWVALQYVDHTSPDHISFLRKTYSLDDLVQDDPFAVLEIIRLILQLDSTPHITTNLGAGLLEDLLTKSGSRVIDRVEEFARSSDSFRQCLLNTWYNSIDPGIQERIRNTIDSAERS
ncbi:DUF6869 domain-containing protein [Pinirhizobacter soli]|uniref:DUF6869 domain-containing protein n=1 Tax=Pinirhizobacter soli TaxID=2786953 RepID=UPI003CCCE19C